MNELDKKIKELKKRLVYNQYWGSNEFGTFLLPPRPNRTPDHCAQKPTTSTTTSSIELPKATLQTDPTKSTVNPPPPSKAPSNVIPETIPSTVHISTSNSNSGSPGLKKSTSIKEKLANDKSLLVPKPSQYPKKPASLNNSTKESNTAKDSSSTVPVTSVMVKLVVPPENLEDEVSKSLHIMTFSLPPPLSPSIPMLKKSKPKSATSSKSQGKSTKRKYGDTIQKGIPSLEAEAELNATGKQPKKIKKSNPESTSKAVKRIKKPRIIRPAKGKEKGEPRLLVILKIPMSSKSDMIEPTSTKSVAALQRNPPSTHTTLEMAGTSSKLTRPAKKDISKGRKEVFDGSSSRESSLSRAFTKDQSEVTEHTGVHSIIPKKKPVVTKSEMNDKTHNEILHLSKKAEVETHHERKRGQVIREEQAERSNHGKSDSKRKAEVLDEHDGSTTASKTVKKLSMAEYNKIRNRALSPSKVSNGPSSVNSRDIDQRNTGSSADTNCSDSSLSHSANSEVSTPQNSSSPSKSIIMHSTDKLRSSQPSQPSPATRTKEFDIPPNSVYQLSSDRLHKLARIHKHLGEDCKSKGDFDQATAHLLEAVLMWTENSHFLETKNKSPDWKTLSSLLHFVKNNVSEWKFSKIVDTCAYLESFLSLKSAIELADTMKRKTTLQLTQARENEQKVYFQSVQQMSEEIHRMQSVFPFLYPPSSNVKYPLALELVKYGRSELKHFLEDNKVQDYQGVID